MVKGLQTVVVNVPDVDRAASFYRDLLGMQQVFEHHGRIGLQCGEARILLHPTEESSRGGAAPWNVELYLQVDDVDQAVDELRKEGVGVLAEPTDEPWGERDAGVLSPDGYPVYLTQSLPGSWIGSPA
jgi:catechol 2,3-dioxygenase-like lactoylglutathione lyase family enzyme